MPVVSVTPATLVGIKRLATQIKKAENLSHYTALDRAAEKAGYQNFRHAQKALQTEGGAKVSPLHRMYLTAYWRDRNSGLRGRETLFIDLDKELLELIDPSKFSNERSLSGFKLSAPDHVEVWSLFDSQSNARRRICAAVRTLRFIEATGLQPAKGYGRVFTGGVSTSDVPGRDHISAWYDPVNKRYLFVSEPYEAAAEASAPKRDAWARSNGIDIARPSWPGMYNPDGGSQIYLFSQKGRGVPLDGIVASLNRLPAPIVEATWNGTSAEATPIFFSPRQGEPTKPKSARAAPKGLSVKQRRRDMHWGRKLLIMGINHLLDQNLLSLDGTGGEKGHCEAEIAGRRSMIIWSDGGFQEVRIAVWWDYDHSRHPQANLNGNSRESFDGTSPLAKRSRYRDFVGAVASGWIEREKGKYLQGKGRKGISDLYLRQDSAAVIAAVASQNAKGFLPEGKFMT